MAVADKEANVIDQWLLAEMDDHGRGKSSSNNSRDLIIACITSILRIGISCSEESPIDRPPIGDVLLDGN